MRESILIVAKNSRVRTHGFQPPFSIAQIMSWISAVVLLLSFIASYLCLTKAVIDDSIFVKVLLPIAAVTYVISFLSMIVYTFRVTISDPTDPTVLLERQFNAANKEGDHSISFQTKDYSFFCDICETHVLIDTKHCQMCNRCTTDFDHHCQWVSNDIGGANYKDFIRMLTSVMTTLII